MLDRKKSRETDVTKNHAPQIRVPSTPRLGLCGASSRALFKTLAIALPLTIAVAPPIFAAGNSITDSTPQKSANGSGSGSGDKIPTDPQLHAVGGDSDSSKTQAPNGAKPEGGVRATLRELLQSWLPSSDNEEEAGAGETADSEGGTPEALDGNVIAPTDVLSKEELAHAIPWRPTNFDGQKGALGWSPATFDITDAFKNRVGFWRDIYSKYSTDQGVIHDTLYIHFIYATMDFSAISKDSSKSPAQKARAREALIKEKKKEVIARLARLKGHTTADGLSGEDLRVWKLFEKVNDPEKFTEAADKSRVRFQLGQRDKFVLGIFYSGRYLRAMEKIFRDEGLPMELTRLPFVESSFNVNARSRVGASGVWQFMRRTAKPFMKVNRDLDERNDPIKATRASARVLKQNYMMLESWPLALTGYNHGPYGVRGIVNKTHTRDLAEIIAKYSSRTFGFASENFYACFLAALDVERHAHKYFGDVKWSGEIESTEIKVTSNTPYRTLVDLFGGDTNLAELLNPQFSSRVRTGRAPIPKGASIRVLPAVVTIANQAVSGKLGGTRLAVAVKAVAKDLSPLKGADGAAASSATVAGGGMQPSVRAKVEQVGQAAQSAMPALTMTNSTVKSASGAPTNVSTIGTSPLEAKPENKRDASTIANGSNTSPQKVAGADSKLGSAKSEKAAEVTAEKSNDTSGVPSESKSPADAKVETANAPDVKAVSASGDDVKTPPATSSETKTHKVKRGENLTHIASEYGVDLQELERINHLDQKSGSKKGRRRSQKGQIHVGQILTIPGVATASAAPSAGAPSAAMPTSPNPDSSTGDTHSAPVIPAASSSVHEVDGAKVLDAKELPGATATPGATPHLNSH